MLPDHTMTTSNHSGPYCSQMELFYLNRCDSMATGMYINIAISVLAFVFGLPASVYIFFEILIAHRRGTALTPNALFILNLSIMDVLFLFTIPFGIINMFLWQNMTIELICNSLYSFNVCGRPLVVALVCCDCYLAVVHPIFYRRWKTLTPRMVVLSVVWFLTMIYAALLGCSFRFFFSHFMIVLDFLTVTIIVLCDSFIVHALLTSDPSRRSVHPQKQRALQTLVYSLAMTLMCYLPPALIFLIGKSQSMSLYAFMCNMVIPIVITCILGSAIMPVFYLYNHRRVDFLRCARCKQ